MKSMTDSPMNVASDGLRAAQHRQSRRPATSARKTSRHRSWPATRGLRVRGLYLALIVALAGVAFGSRTAAQQAGQNVNVLPVVVDSEGNVVGDPLTTDYYMQRQMEVTTAASTRNPNHLVAFFNDYRAVQVPDDTYIGETSASNNSVVG